MALADAIANAMLRPGPKCRVALLRANLDKKDLAVLEDALASAGVSTSAIVTALRSEGHDIARSSIERHRRGDCACGTR